MANRDRSGWGWIAFFALSALGPGAVTFLIALQERKPDGDFFYISLPLLGLGGLLLSWCLGRLVGKVGAIIGLALLLAGGGAVWVMHQQVAREWDEFRAQRDARRAAEEAMLAVCEDGQPAADARPFDSASTRPRTIGVFRRDYESAPLKLEYSGRLGDWRPERLDEADLVACVERSRRVIDRCQYTGGTLERVIELETVSVRAVSTGAVVLEQVFEGAAPGPCEMTETFYGGATTQQKSGGYPDASLLEGLISRLANGDPL